MARLTQNQRRSLANRTILADEGTRVVVRSLKRRVRITVIDNEISSSANLDVDAVDKLVRRLQAVRGGKRGRTQERRSVPTPDTPRLR